MGESFGVDGGSEIGSSNGMSDGNVDGKLVRSSLGDYSFSLESITEVYYSVGSSYGKVSSSLIISYGKVNYYVGISVGNEKASSSVLYWKRSYLAHNL